jgi:hypothetical protein
MSASTQAAGGGVHAIHAERCSRLSATVGEPTAGTAPAAAGWIALEQPGPWGREAATESHLDPDLGRDLATRALSAGARLALIRRPGRHPDTGDGRTVWLACTVPGRTALYRARVGDPRALLDLDLAGLCAGRVPALGEPVTGPVLLVCTNARRDACCALYGRPLAQALAGRYPGRVWEASHLGGHRFAPTALLLAGGYAYGRLTVERAARVLDAANSGRVHLPGLRGRTSHPPAGQVAEVAVREMTGVDGPDALRVGEPGDGVVTVDHVDGRAWRVRIGTTSHGVVRPESCGKPVKPLAYPQVRSVDRIR